MPESRSARLKILCVSGPNLDRLGHRQPELYGRTTLASIHRSLQTRAKEANAQVVCRQSNLEGELCGWLAAASEKGFSGVLLNAAAYTHTSVALLDALLCAGLPAVEVHLTHPEAREAFRRHSIIAEACLGKVSGFGAASYLLGLEGLLGYLKVRSG